MSPVCVLISHMPPVDVLGTLISPVEVLVINTFSESKVPVISPVFDLTEIAEASLLSNMTSPVLLSRVKSSEAITLLSIIFPVWFSAEKLLQLMSVDLIFPVSDAALTRPSDVTVFIFIFPVAVNRLIFFSVWSNATDNQYVHAIQALFQRQC